MKKVLMLAICAMSICSANAQKATVDQAAKLSGDLTKIGEARALIQEAMTNPETANEARTYYVAGKLEFDAYDDGVKRQALNPGDPAVNPVEMSRQMINGFNEFMKALPLDTVVDAKGKVKTKFSKDIVNRLNGCYNDYFSAGGILYNASEYYPDAYNAFMIYGDMPSMPFANKMVQAIPDSMVNSAYFNAGVCAYASNHVDLAAAAFKKARLNNSDNPQSYVYEIACWQNIANNDESKMDESKAAVKEIAAAGFNKFGMDQPLFFNNIVNSMILDGEMDNAIALVSEEITKHPENAALYGLRGFVYDKMEKDDESMADYKKAAGLPNCDIETLKNVIKKAYRVGATKLEATDAKDKTARDLIKADYFQYAKDLSDKAKTMQGDHSDLDYVIENIDYALSTYFN